MRPHTRYGITDALRDVISSGGLPEMLLSTAVLLLVFGALLFWYVILWAVQP